MRYCTTIDIVNLSALAKKPSAKKVAFPTGGRDSDKDRVAMDAWSRRENVRARWGFLARCPCPRSLLTRIHQTIGQILFSNHWKTPMVSGFWLVGCVRTIFRGVFVFSCLVLAFQVWPSHTLSLQTSVHCFWGVLLQNDCPLHGLCKRKSNATEAICFWEFLLFEGPLPPRVFAS